MLRTRCWYGWLRESCLISFDAIKASATTEKPLSIPGLQKMEHGHLTYKTKLQVNDRFVLMAVDIGSAQKKSY